MNTQPFNIASLLRETAAESRLRRAVVYPTGTDRYGRTAYAHLTFEQLDRESDALAHGLETTGIGRGTRTVLMVPPGPDFFLLTFALFKTGAVPVVVDPGMGLGRMVQCFSETAPEAFIGIPKAHLLRLARPRFFRTASIRITAGRRWLWGGASLDKLRKVSDAPYPIAETGPEETAAILFTTGSTGPAKGAVYTHGMFRAQIRAIREHFHIGPDEVDLPTFPLFALFDPALGMTAIIPDMDPTRPARVDPEKILQPILAHGVTNMFASPALLRRVGPYGKEKGISLPCLRRVVSAGAPVSPDIIEQFAALLPETARIHTPYGATEAVPVTSIASDEILSDTANLTRQGYGMCIGRPIDGIETRIIRVSDDPIEGWLDDLLVKDGEIGEILVRGDLVSREYFARPEENALAKIREGDKIWHRMGDLGWRDKKGRFWFCGRKSQRVITEKGDLFTIPCESIFNNHPRVLRSALVGIGLPPVQIPVICIELKPGDSGRNREELKRELLDLARENVFTEDIETVLFHKSFPVDIRHNSKIFRERLAVWAEKELKGKIAG